MGDKWVHTKRLFFKNSTFHIIAVINPITTLIFVGSKRISDSEVSDYDCDDGIGVVSGNEFTTTEVGLFGCYSLLHPQNSPLFTPSQFLPLAMGTCELLKYCCLKLGFLVLIIHISPIVRKKGLEVMDLLSEDA